MKKALLITLGLILLLTMPCFAQLSISADQKITKVEVNPDVAEWVLDTIKILLYTSTCELTYRKVDNTGASTGKEKIVRFRDVEDDLETPEDETDTSFTDLIAKLPKFIKIMVDETKIKLGL